MARFSDLLGDDGDARDPWAPTDEHTGAGEEGDDAAPVENVAAEVVSTDPAPVERPAPRAHRRRVSGSPTW